MGKHDAVLDRFREDLKNFQESLTFWQGQPAIEVGHGFTNEPRAAQINMLAIAIQQTETAIKVLETDPDA